MEIVVQNIKLPAGFICKWCNDNFSGHYVVFRGDMFVKGECRCSFWLVKSSYLDQEFYYFRQV